jgi:hypothetical protein
MHHKVRLQWFVYYMEKENRVAGVLKLQSWDVQAADAKGLE